MSEEEIIFKYVGFGLYRIVRNSFIFRPEAFKLLSNKNGSFNRVCFNLWVKR